MDPTKRPSPGPSASAGAPVLGASDFALFRELISRRSGVRVAESKQLLLQNRLGRRLQALGLPSFQAYYRYLRTAEGEARELGHFWSVVTTHETHFFREEQHFAALEQAVLPELTGAERRPRTLRLWSAGCSTGQEAYSLAMVVDGFLQRRPGYRYEVVGTDIDEHALATGRAGIYPLASRVEVPARHLVRHVDLGPQTLQIRAALRQHVTFAWQNFAEARALRPACDVVFCRNAMMYLEREVRVHLLQVFWESLAPDGVLVVGAAESLHGLPRRFAPHRVGKTLLHRKVAEVHE
ncbi:MAG: protein-glutamate O-methyltransferase CheR [Polyangiaceae bacterium]|nr:protein-glutamate O-methyltransferase CheR [Polyangiaceae bacterium]